jgi:hypothetical protein
MLGRDSVNGNGILCSPRTTLEAARFIKAELKRSGVTYGELAKRLESQGLHTQRRRSQINDSRDCSPTLLLATLAALGMDGMKLDDL